MTADQDKEFLQAKVKVVRYRGSAGKKMLFFPQCVLGLRHGNFSRQQATNPTTSKATAILRAN